jgi:hypothetical protein
MASISGKGLVPESVPLAQALQGGSGGGAGRRFWIQDDLQAFDHQTAHGRLLFGCSNFNPLQERVWEVYRRSHGLLYMHRYAAATRALSVTPNFGQSRAKRDRPLMAARRASGAKSIDRIFRINGIVLIYLRFG